MLGGLELGFKPEEIAARQLMQQVENICNTYRNSPYLGVPENIATDSGEATRSYNNNMMTTSEILDTGYNEDQNIRSIYCESNLTSAEVGLSLLVKRARIQYITGSLL